MFDKIGKSKDRRTLLKLVKEHFPDTVIPEIDASAPYEDRLSWTPIVRQPEPSPKV
jgi:hypothetical protein